MSQTASHKARAEARLNEALEALRFAREQTDQGNAPAADPYLVQARSHIQVALIEVCAINEA